MRNFFKSRIFRVTAFILAAVMVFSLLFYFFGSDGSPLGKASRAVLSPFQKAFNFLAVQTKKVFAAYTRYNALLEENEQLKAEIRDMQELIRDAEANARENEELRALLGMREKHREYDIISATIIGWNETAWSSVFTVNKGSADGVAKGDAVITDDGLVGFVTSVDADSCRISTLLDSSVSVGVWISRNRLTAVARGTLELMGDNRLELAYIAKGSDILVGDFVVTSGISGAVPSGLLIGTVETIKSSSDGLSDFAVVTPAVNVSKLTTVYIIRDFAVVE
jgi:rod shape-determining protein MreC